MTTLADFDRPDDALYLNVELRHVVELPILGIPVRFESNSAAVLEGIEAWFGMWRALAASPDLVALQGVRVRLIVHDGTEGGPSPAAVTCRIPDPDRLILRTPGSVGIADLRRRDAIAYLTPALLADPSHLSHGMIHGLTLTLVTTCDRRPVHASGVTCGRTALLLAAPPGTGKSTLAYQAHRSGLHVLADDATYVQVEPELRVWGLPGRLLLPPEACAHFPELAGRAPTWLANGDRKVVVDLSGEWPRPDAVPPTATRCGVCVLERTGGRANLAPVSPQDVQALLIEGVGPSRVFHGEALDRAMGALAAGGGWRLSLSENPADAMPFIERMLAELERRA
jgi:hypothetical protein